MLLRLIKPTNFRVEFDENDTPTEYQLCDINCNRKYIILDLVSQDERHVESPGHTNWGILDHPYSQYIKYAYETNKLFPLDSLSPSFYVEGTQTIQSDGALGSYINHKGNPVIAPEHYFLIAEIGLEEKS